MRKKSVGRSHTDHDQIAVVTDSGPRWCAVGGTGCAGCDEFLPVNVT
jgi:hypothetical protein